MNTPEKEVCEVANFWDGEDRKLRDVMRDLAGGEEALQEIEDQQDNLGGAE